MWLTFRAELRAISVLCDLPQLPLMLSFFSPSWDCVLFKKSSSGNVNKNAKMALRFCSPVVSFLKIRDERVLDITDLYNCSLCEEASRWETVSYDRPRHDPVGLRKPGIYGPPSEPCQSGREGEAADMCKLSAGTRPSDTDWQEVRFQSLLSRISYFTLIPSIRYFLVTAVWTEVMIRLQ